jgi:peptide/nickel transport system permease protein
MQVGAASVVKSTTLHPLVWFVLRRLATAIGLMIAASILIFVATHVLPGDPARAILGRAATDQQIEAFRHELGLDRSLAAQYWTWISGVAQGDLGTSLASTESVSSFIGSRIGNSLILALVTMILLVPIGLALGVWAGIRQGRRTDHIISILSLGLIALPEYVTGTLLIVLLAGAVTLFPPTSLIQIGASPLTNPDILVLPAVSLCIICSAYVIRMVRAGVVEAMASDYVQMARLNGIPERRVVWRHALRNSLAPTVQVLAYVLQYLIGGLVVIETVFDYPGLGQGFVQAVSARDFAVVEGVAVLLGALYIVINIVADLLVVLLVPKLRTSQ